MLSESRKNLRIKENLGVAWQLKDKDIQGKGKILNLSTTGVLLSTKDFPEALPSNMVQLDSLLNAGDKFLPSEGRLVWSEKRRNRFFCGIEFIDPPESTLASLRERIQNQITKATKSRRVQSFVGAGLLVIMLALIAYILMAEKDIFQNITLSNHLLLASTEQQSNLTRTYTKLYEDTKELLEATQKELTATKAVLDQTSQLLKEANRENQNLKIELAGLKGESVEVLEEQAQGEGVRNDLTKKIDELTERNNQLVQEMTGLKEKIRIFEGDIKSQEEGRQVIALFNSRIKIVKGKLHDIKKEAHFAKIAAQKEKDRILLLKGNQGYFLKEGKEVYKGNSKETGGKDVQIGVTFVE